MTAPQVLTLDIENTAQVIEAWGSWQVDAIRILRPTFVLCVAGKWLNQSKPFIYSMDEYPLYKRDKLNDREVIKAIWKDMDKADVIITHNGDQHDLKILNARFFYHKLGLPSPYISIDTKKLAKRVGRFPTNKLKHIREFRGEHFKEDSGGYGTWEGCLSGDPKAWKGIKPYCMNDVVVTEKTYIELRPYAPANANLSVFYERDGCPACGSVGIIKRGYTYTRTGKRQKYQCHNCGAWCSGKHEKFVDVR